MQRTAMDITLSHNRTMSVRSYMSIVGYRVSSIDIDTYEGKERRLDRHIEKVSA